ncbi:MAG: thiosulfate oxidation carrier protein SoxY [Rhodospirillales bacterium]|nr:thiosulfate oxidation carrier protein SoxY [Rhodospirillales bacterium]
MIIEPMEEYRLSRRQVLVLGGVALATTAIFGLTPFNAKASPKEARAKLAELAKGAELQKGRINITLPKLTQDGSRTRIKFAVDSPMTEQDYVKSVHILAERNTVPNVGTYHFTPLSGKAEITTRIRIVKSQTIIVAAEMSDGSIYYAKARCNVARGAGGCG